MLNTRTDELVFHESAQRLREVDPAAIQSTALACGGPSGSGVLPPTGGPLGGDASTAASVVDYLGQLVEAGLTVCTLWLPIQAEQVGTAMEWVAAEVAPHLV